MRIWEVVQALLTAYKSKNVDYIKSAVDLIHDEFTFTVSESESLTDEALQKACTIHALFGFALGLLRDLKGEEERARLDELIDAAYEGDLTSLTKAIALVTRRTLHGDRAVLDEFKSRVESRNDGLPACIFRSFLNIIEQVVRELSA